MENPLQREFEWYKQHQGELLKKYNGKFVVIKNQAVLGAYDDAVSAATETSKTHALGTFLVQKVEPGESAYSQTFHSRVSFSLG
jgi:hypothetical protein